MGTWYNAQLLGGEGRYCIQFETGNYEYFKMVEKACQKAIDKSNEARDKSREQTMSVLGHL